MPYAESRSDSQVIMAIARYKLPRRPTSEAVGTDIWELLNLCWKFDPQERPRMSEVTQALGRICGQEKVIADELRMSEPVLEAEVEHEKTELPEADLAEPPGQGIYSTLNSAITKRVIPAF